MLEPDKIYNLDCFSAATEIPDDSVDVVLTDPPYPNRMHLFPDTLIDGIAMLYLSCKKAKNYVAFFWNPFDVPQPPAGWHEVARNVWHKPDTKSITHYELIIIWSKEPRQKVSRVWSIPILDYRSLHDWKPHPTQKPVRLMRYLLEQVTKEGDLVLDPFVGTGTTAVACKQMKRHYIGIEVDPKYAEIADKRLQGKVVPAEDKEPVEPTTDRQEITDTPPMPPAQQTLPTADSPKRKTKKLGKRK
ncbi:MAG: site-specific DNA-methyltransferase [Acidobacteriota bacterium]|nr:site-specific DNA-methyltransferase [Acidobacteriota bacterium]